MKEFLILIVGLVAGGIIVWLTKDTIQKWLLGAAAFETALQAKLDAIKGALRR